MRTKINSLSEQARAKTPRGQTHTNIYIYISGTLRSEKDVMDKLESRDSQRKGTYWKESLKKEQVTGDRLQQCMTGVS